MLCCPRHYTVVHDSENMFSKNLLLIICLICLESHALNCRSEGSLKTVELKKIYNNCFKQHESKNSSNSNRMSTGQDWRDRGSAQSYSNDWSNSDSKRGTSYRNDDEGRNWMDGRLDSMGTYNDGERSQMDRRDSTNDGRNQYDYRGYERNNGMSDRNNQMGNSNRNNNGYQNNYQNENSNERNGYYQSDDYGNLRDSQSQKMDSNSNRRYKRDRSEKNSGQRSQYNPNTQRSDDNHRDSRNSSDTKEKGKACAMHCFLDNLHMTGDNGMPDRYLVTNTLTKDVRNEDLRDFLQESIEECFQILDNENTEDKCEFSKNLLICLSEKGRSNCDDWKDDIQFT